MIGGVQRYVFGVDQCGGVVYKNSHGEIIQGELGVATGLNSDGEAPAIGALALAVTEVPSACFVEITNSLSASGKYNISGTCTPSNAVVYISAGYRPQDNVYLRKNIIARTTPGDDGNFTFTGITGPDDVITVWLSAELEYLEIMSIDNIVVTSYIDPVIPPITPPEEDDDDGELTPPVQSHIIYYSFTASNQQWIVCSSCGGDPVLKTGDPCRQCNGNKTYSAEITCGNCDGSGKINNADCPDCVGGKKNLQFNCDLCDENGLYKEFDCTDCNGDGYLSNGSVCACIGGKVTTTICDSCNGNGGSFVTYDKPGVIINATVPADVSVVSLTVLPGDGSIDVDALINANVVASMSVYGAGEFSLSSAVTNGTRYVMWAETTVVDGEFTNVDIEVVDESRICLSGDTIITMADGSEKRLDSLQVGEFVLSQDGIPTEITALKRGNYSNCHTIYYFDDGTVIDEIHKHRFYNSDQGFWQRLQSWNIGDHAVNQHGERIALIRKEVIHERAEQFGIWTEDGSYYANGLLSGSADCNKRIIPNMTVDQAIDVMLSIGNSKLLPLMGIEGELP